MLPFQQQERRKRKRKEKWIRIENRPKGIHPSRGVASTNKSLANKSPNKHKDQQQYVLLERRQKFHSYCFADIPPLELPALDGVHCLRQNAHVRQKKKYEQMIETQDVARTLLPSEKKKKEIPFYCNRLQGGRVPSDIYISFGRHTTMEISQWEHKKRSGNTVHQLLKWPLDILMNIFRTVLAYQEITKLPHNNAHPLIERKWGKLQDWA